MFESVTIHLNGNVVTKNPSKYPYRSYISKLLSYPKWAKMTWMQGEGWYEDETGKFIPADFTTDSEGFRERRELFMTRLENEQTPIRFNTDFVPMYGKIYSDLNTMHCAILPGIQINIKMEFSPNKFRICSKSAENIKIEINKVLLHMPVATINPNLYKSIETRLAKEACRIFYTRCEVSHFTINRGSQTFNQIINASTGSGASRMTIAFLTLKAFEGSYQLNPYEFSRRWGYKNATTKVMEYYYVKKVEISLNGRPLDCMNAQATAHDDQVSFLRMNQILGNISAPTNNGIDYRRWCDNSALYLFDLTVTGRSGKTAEILSPIVKTGDTRIDVTFGGSPTLTEMKLLVIQEFPSLMTINKERGINFSYFSAVN